MHDAGLSDDKTGSHEHDEGQSPQNGSSKDAPDGPGWLKAFKTRPGGELYPLGDEEAPRGEGNPLRADKPIGGLKNSTATKGGTWAFPSYRFRQARTFALRQ
jgi:hypothetical protein